LEKTTLKKRVGIFGANSAIAKNFIKDYKDIFQITAFTRSFDVDASDVDLVLTDYSNLSKLSSHIKKCDYIIYCNGITNGSNKLIEKINIELFDSFLKELPNSTKIIFISSASILYNENTYSKSKKYAEEALAKKGNPFIALRPSVMYGAYDQNNIQKIFRFMQMSPVFPIIGKDYKIQPVYLSDISELMMTAIKNDIFKSRAYILSGPSQITMKELTVLLKKKLDRLMILIPIPLSLVQFLVRVLSFIIPSNKILAYQVLNMKLHDPFKSDDAINDFNFRQTEFHEGLNKF
jgi:NADH dehydrogenase